MLVQKTLSFGNNTGYVMVLDATKGFSSITLRSTQTIYVKTIPFKSPIDTLVAPTASVIPATGTISDYYKVAANEVVKFGYETPLGASANSYYVDSIQQLLIWSTLAGDLVINAH